MLMCAYFYRLLETKNNNLKTFHAIILYFIKLPPLFYRYIYLVYVGEKYYEYSINYITHTCVVVLCISYI